MLRTPWGMEAGPGCHIPAQGKGVRPPHPPLLPSAAVGPSGDLSSLGHPCRGGPAAHGSGVEVFGTASEGWGGCRGAGPPPRAHHPHTRWDGSGLGRGAMVRTGAATVPNKRAPACSSSSPSCPALKGRQRGGRELGKLVPEPCQRAQECGEKQFGLGRAGKPGAL